MGANAEEAQAQAANRGQPSRRAGRPDHRHRDQARLDGPGRPLLDQRPDAGRHPARQRRPSRISAATSPASPCRTSGPGQSQVAIRGVSAGQIVRDQPGVKEQVGVYLDESVISLSLFTPGPRPVRPQPRRGAARPAGHAVRLGLASAAPSATSPTSRSSAVTEGLVEANVNHVNDGESAATSRA